MQKKSLQRRLISIKPGLEACRALESLPREPNLHRTTTQLTHHSWKKQPMAKCIHSTASLEQREAQEYGESRPCGPPIAPSEPCISLGRSSPQHSAMVPLQFLRVTAFTQCGSLPSKTAQNLAIVSAHCQSVTMLLPSCLAAADAQLQSEVQEMLASFPGATLVAGKQQNPEHGQHLELLLQGVPASRKQALILAEVRAGGMFAKHWPLELL
jgi:hypothetical protein